MKKKIAGSISVFMVLILLLTSCGPGEGVLDCEDDCVSVVIDQPIQINQPVKLTITVQSTQHRQAAYISVDSTDRTAVQFTGEKSWTLELQPNIEYSVETLVIFNKEASLGVIGMLSVTPGAHKEGIVFLQITSTGGTVIPPNTPSTPAGTPFHKVTPEGGGVNNTQPPF